MSVPAELGLGAPRKVPTNIDQLCAEAVRLASAANRDLKLDLMTEMAPDLPQVSVDTAMLLRVLVHFLARALRSTPEGGSVLIEGRRQGSDAVLSLVDTGTGMPLERSSTGHGAEEDGELSVCKQILETHGGSLAASGKPGSGTTILITLPLDAGPEAAIPEAAAQEPPPPQPEPPAPPSQPDSIPASSTVKNLESKVESQERESSRLATQLDQMQDELIKLELDFAKTKKEPPAPPTPPGETPAKNSDTAVGPEAGLSVVMPALIILALAVLALVVGWFFLGKSPSPRAVESMTQEPPMSSTPAATEPASAPPAVQAVHLGTSSPQTTDVKPAPSPQDNAMGVPSKSQAVRKSAENRGRSRYRIRPRVRISPKQGPAVTMPSPEGGSAQTPQTAPDEDASDAELFKILDKP